MAEKSESTSAEDPLVGRIRSALGDNRMIAKKIIEQKMFGGVGFMLDGNMVAGTLRRELLVRVGKEAHDAALKRPGARPMEQGGRVAAGYIVVADAGTRGGKDLRRWLDMAVGHVSTLPPKTAGKTPAAKRAAGRKAR